MERTSLSGGCPIGGRQPIVPRVQRGFVLGGLRTLKITPAVLIDKPSLVDPLAPCLGIHLWTIWLPVSRAPEGEFEKLETRRTIYIYVLLLSSTALLHFATSNVSSPHLYLRLSTPLLILPCSRLRFSFQD